MCYGGVWDQSCRGVVFCVVSRPDSFLCGVGTATTGCGFMGEQTPAAGALPGGVESPTTASVYRGKKATSEIRTPDLCFTQALLYH